MPSKSTLTHSTASLFKGAFDASSVTQGRTSSSSAATAALTTPTADISYSDINNWLGIVGGVCSPTWCLFTAAPAVLDKLAWLGYPNPLDKVTETLVGDWKRLDIASSALDHLAAYFDIFNTETTRAWSETASQWSGGASDAANAALTDMASDFHSVSTALSSLSDEYHAVAIGAVAGYIIAGAAILRMCETTITIVETLDTIWQIATLFAGNCAFLFGAASGAGDPIDITTPSFSEG